jgi:hypothetical protein
MNASDLAGLLRRANEAGVRLEIVGCQSGGAGVNRQEDAIRLLPKSAWPLQCNRFGQRGQPVTAPF